MKKLLIVLSLCVFVIGCDDMSKPAMDVIGDIVTPAEESTIEVAPPIETTRAEIPKITFENALDLQPGNRYRFRPTHINAVNSHLKDEAWVNTIHWGNVLYAEPFQRADFPDDAPKIALRIHPNNLNYYYTPDGEPVIEHAVEGAQGLSDEIVVEIEKRHVITVSTGGENASQFEFHFVSYIGSVIENLTNPDLKFEEL